MKKLNLAGQLLIAVTVFAIPICVLTFLMYRARTVNIDFGIQEKKGNELQRPLENVMRNVSFHKVLAQRVLNGEETASGRLAEFSGKVDQAFSSLEPSYKKLLTDLDFTEEGLKKRKRDTAHFDSAKKMWDDLKNGLRSLKPTASNEKHIQLIATLRTMIAHMGDTSNLILDPDLDSYYLMDVTLLALPQTQDRVQDIMTNVEPLLHRGEITNDERIQLAVYASMLKEADIARVLASTDVSLNEDSNFFGRSESLQTKVTASVQEYKTAAEAFHQILVQLADPKNPLPKVEDFNKAGEAALAASYDYWNVAVDELDGLLSSRLENLTNERNREMVYATLTLIAACVLSFFIGRNLRKVLTAITSRIARSADQVGSASAEMATASERLSSAATEGAATLEESVASIEELSSMVQRNADHAREAQNLSQAASQAAEAGEREVQQLVLAMGEISQSSKKIEEIINVIDDIAFQTNLLALNAAVEAARAGEQGKGFAVVADAVRTLAQRSADAAKDINSLIRDSVERVQKGTELANKSGGVLNSIVGQIKQVSALNSEICTASQEQSTGILQISKAMNQLDQVTQGNAISAGETANASNGLAKESSELQSHVIELRVIVEGQNAAVRAETTLVPSEQAARNVVKFTKAPALKSGFAEKTIPFDDDGKGGFGSTAGF